MQWPGRNRIRFKDADTHQHIYLLGEMVVGPKTGRTSIEQIARPISAKHAAYGDVLLNEAKFQSFIKNFNDNVYGQEIYLDRNHDLGAGVQGTLRKLFTQGGNLFAEIEWSDKGIKTFTDDGFKYFSIDFVDNYVNQETQKSYGPLLFGVALLPRPFIKNMTPSQGPGRMLFSEGGRVIFVPTHVQLTEDAQMTLAQILAALRGKMISLKLSEKLISVLLAQFESTAKLLGESDPKLAQLQASFETQATQLAEQISAAGDPSGQGGLQLSEAQLTERIVKGVADAMAAAEQSRIKLTQTLEGNRKRFNDAIDAEKGLSETTKALLKEQAIAINANLTEAQIDGLSASAIKLGNQMEVQAKKLSLGMRPNASGQLPTVLLNSDVGATVHGFMRERLLLTDTSGPDKLKLPEEKNLKSFARKVLAEFDRIHGHRLESEHKLLSGDGSTVISDGQFPVVAQRQVILELLADLNFLALVQTIVDPTAQATMQIPYEIRNTSTIKNGGITYEGNPIARAGVTQQMDNSYIIPRKIAMLISNEMINFSRVAQINWDAWARNIASNARLMRDIMAAAIANAMQRASDSYQAVPVALEVHTAQVDGARNLFKAAFWPIVRQHQPRDLQGTTVGAVQNPLSVLLAAATLTEWDGTGKQAAGNYFHITDYNMGFYQIVNQAGVVQTPANATVLKLSYSYATNVVKFDLDCPNGVDNDFYLNGLLNAIGRRKATLSQTRFVQPNFAICSNTLHQTITEARQFERQHEKNGTQLNADGSVGMVKQIPIWETNQPGIDMGDGRILLGESGNTTYGISRPFATGMPFEVVKDDGSGQLVPTGEKQAYGEEYSTIHTPVPVRGRYTSVVVFSTTARAAA